jgi:hypothetical protein
MDGYFFEEFVIRYALVWNGEDLSGTGLMNKMSDVDFLITASIQFEKAQPFLVEILHHSNLEFSPQWYEYILEIAPEFADRCKRKDLLYLPAILRKTLKECYYQKEYDEEMVSWLNNEPTLSLIKNFAIEENIQWSSLRGFLETLRNEAYLRNENKTIKLICWLFGEKPDFSYPDTPPDSDSGDSDTDSDRTDRRSDDYWGCYHRPSFYEIRKKFSPLIDLTPSVRKSPPGRNYSSDRRKNSPEARNHTPEPERKQSQSRESSQGRQSPIKKKQRSSKSKLMRFGCSSSSEDE